MSSDVTSPRPEIRLLSRIGWILILSGLLHIVVWACLGGEWEGSVSWRKPILFGVSGGVTVLSLGWVANFLKRRARDRWLLRLFGIAMFFEVGLITLQQWRGVPSHFNRETSVDAAILTGIEVLITVASIVILDLTIRSFGSFDASRDTKLAIRAGMLLLVLGCVLGFLGQAIGSYQMSVGQSPHTFGKAGVLKFPHGIPLHAIQMLPIVAWGLRQFGTKESTRYRAVQLCTLSIVLFTIYGCVQTLAGRARFETDPATATVLVASIALLMHPAWLATRHALMSWAEPTKAFVQSGGQRSY